MSLKESCQLPQCPWLAQWLQGKVHKVDAVTDAPECCFGCCNYFQFYQGELNFFSSVLQGDDDTVLPLPTRDYSSLEIHVFTVLNINTFIPLVSGYTLHCSTAPCRENSQISP